MNILVVNPPNKPFTNKNIIAEPIDVIQIATIINNYYKDIKVIDMDVKQMDNNLNFYLKDNELNIVIFIYDYQIPLHTTSTSDNIFKIIKNYNTDVKTILIGKTPSYKATYFIENGVDIVIEGEAEERIVEVIKNIENENLLKIKGLYLDTIYTGKYIDKVDFSMLPIPNRDLVNIGDYNDVRTIISSRGCNGCCNYCSTPFFFGMNWRNKSAKMIIKEILFLYTKYKTKKVMFLDDNFTVDKKRIEELCYGLEKIKVDIKFGCLSSIKNYDYDLFKKMYSVGFRWVHFGIESGSYRILKLMSKDMDIEYIRKVIKELKQIGYRIRTSYILDYPTQTINELDSTLKLIEELDTEEIRLHFLARKLGTPLYKTEEKDQYIHSSKSKTLTDKENDLINEFLEKMVIKGYKIIKSDSYYSQENDNKLNKIIALAPLKYGVGWNE